MAEMKTRYYENMAENRDGWRRLVDGAGRTECCGPTPQGTKREDDRLWNRTTPCCSTGTLYVARTAAPYSHSMSLVQPHLIHTLCRSYSRTLFTLYVACTASPYSHSMSLVQPHLIHTICRSYSLTLFTLYVARTAAPYSHSMSLVQPHLIHTLCRSYSLTLFPLYVARTAAPYSHSMLLVQPHLIYTLLNMTKTKRRTKQPTTGQI